MNPIARLGSLLRRHLTQFEVRVRFQAVGQVARALREHDLVFCGQNEKMRALGVAHFVLWLSARRAMGGSSCTMVTRGSARMRDHHGTPREERGSADAVQCLVR